MHLQKYEGDPKDVPKSFIDKPFVRIVSYIFAIILLVGLIGDPIADGRFPSFGSTITCLILIGYLYSDQKIMRARKQTILENKTKNDK